MNSSPLKYIKKPLHAFAFAFFLSMCFLFIKSPSAKAWQVDAEWVDASHVKVNSVTFEEANRDGLQDEVKGQSTGDISKWLNEQVGNNKVYEYPDLTELRPDRLGQNDAQYWLHGLCKATQGGLNFGVQRDPTDSATIDFGGGQLDSGQTGDFVFGTVPINVGGDSNVGCQFLLNKANSGYKFHFDMKKPERHHIFFKATDKDTLVRVDGKDGNFKRGVDKTKFFREDKSGSCPDTGAYVQVTDNNGDVSGDVIHAAYETCDKAGRYNVDVAGLNDVKNNPGVGGGAGSGTAGPSCESNNGKIIIGWLVCGFLGILDDAVNKSTEVVDNLLDFDANDIQTGTNADQLKTVWSMFRIISSVSLLAVALVMVIGQAVGGD